MDVHDVLIEPLCDLEKVLCEQRVVRFLPRLDIYYLVRFLVLDNDILLVDLLEQLLRVGV